MNKETITFHIEREGREFLRVCQVFLRTHNSIVISRQTSRFGQHTSAVTTYNRSSPQHTRTTEQFLRVSWQPIKSLQLFDVNGLRSATCICNFFPDWLWKERSQLIAWTIEYTSDHSKLACAFQATPTDPDITLRLQVPLPMNIQILRISQWI